MVFYPTASGIQILILPDIEIMFFFFLGYCWYPHMILLLWEIFFTFCFALYFLRLILSHLRHGEIERAFGLPKSSPFFSQHLYAAL